MFPNPSIYARYFSFKIMNKTVVIILIATIFCSSIQPALAFPVSGNYIGLNSGVAEPFSQFDGKVVLVEAFATWCQPCHQEFYEMSKLNAAFKGNLTIFSISVDSSDTIQKVKVFKAQAEQTFGFKATWDIGLAISGQTDQPAFTTVMGIVNIPTTILVSANGTIEKKWVGVVNAKEIGAYLDANVTFPASNPSNELIAQITSNIFFKMFMVSLIILVVYQVLIPKSKKIKDVID